MGSINQTLSVKLIFTIMMMVITVKSQLTADKTFDITKTWDNQTTDIKITVKLSTTILYPSTESQLEITVDAPFYDDPHMPDDAPKESFMGLWDYEVVELFLLGNDDHYLEIELGPKGQYLLLQLKGYRNAIMTQMSLYNNHFNATITDKNNPYPDGNATWHGRAVIPNCYLPQNITKFNAYAIHANSSEISNDNRTYMSLFPVPTGKYEGADFHRLEYFGDWTDFDYSSTTTDSGYPSTTLNSYSAIITSNLWLILISLTLMG